MTKEMLSSLKLLITLTFLVISLPNQHMEFSHPKSFVMLGSAVRKVICSKGLRASPKNYYGNTTPSMASMSKETSLDHDQTGPKTSPEPHRRITEPHRRITINILGIFGTSFFYLSYLLHKQADVQLDEVTPVAGGLTLHSCYCN